MSTIIQEIKKNNNDTLYPITKAEAVYMADNTHTVQGKISNHDTSIEDIQTTVGELLTDLTGKLEVSISYGNMSHALKFSNGTLICYKMVTGTANCTKAWGNWYYNETKFNLGNWQINFLNTPYTVANLMNGGDCVFGGLTGTTPTSVGSCYFYTPISVSNRNISLVIIAIGKYK